MITFLLIALLVLVSALCSSTAAWLAKAMAHAAIAALHKLSITIPDNSTCMAASKAMFSLLRPNWGEIALGQGWLQLCSKKDPQLRAQSHLHLLTTELQWIVQNVSGPKIKSANVVPRSDRKGGVPFVRRMTKRAAPPLITHLCQEQFPPLLLHRVAKTGRGGPFRHQQAPYRDAQESQIRPKMAGFSDAPRHPFRRCNTLEWSFCAANRTKFLLYRQHQALISLGGRPTGSVSS